MPHWKRTHNPQIYAFVFKNCWQISFFFFKLPDKGGCGHNSNRLGATIATRFITCKIQKINLVENDTATFTEPERELKRNYDGKTPKYQRISL